MMRLGKAWIIVRKEFSEYRKNRYILYTLFLMPLLMAVVLPTVYLMPAMMMGGQNQTQPYDLQLNITYQMTDIKISNASISDTRLINCTTTNCVLVKCELWNCTAITSLVTNSEFNYSESIKSTIRASNIRSSIIDAGSNTADSVIIGQESETVKYTKFMVNVILMFFILIPAIIPTVIASYSFVGEKLNKSLEPLLATPTTDAELLAGKALAIFLPSMLVTWVSLLPTIILVDLITKPFFGYYILPDAIWLVGVFFVAPLVCVLTVLFNVIVSARVTDVRTSQQIGSIIVLPVIAFFIVGLLGVLTFSLVNILLFGIVLAAVDIGVIYLALSMFQRERILVRWK